MVCYLISPTVDIDFNLRQYFKGLLICLCPHENQLRQQIPFFLTKLIFSIKIDYHILWKQKITRRMCVICKTCQSMIVWICINGMKIDVTPQKNWHTGNSINDFIRYIYRCVPWQFFWVYNQGSKNLGFKLRPIQVNVPKNATFVLL